MSEPRDPFAVAAPETPTLPREPSIRQILASMEGWGASDLFVCEGRPPAVRLHGSVVPLEVPPTSAETLQRFLERALPEVARRRYAETGDLDAGYSLSAGRRFRLNLARQMGHDSMVARALPSGEITFESLRLPETVGRLANLHRGLVLVTGATGAGKSTTLAAMIHHINCKRRSHIVTIEEPIEFVHSDRKSRVTQREVGIDTKSFDIALRQVVRESPDVILIGEMRDLSTMRVAIQAALTGHLVFASVHTIDAAQTLQRVISFFPEDQRSQVSLDLSMCLKGVVSQRLLPRADGQGRVAAIELLTVTPAAARLIRDLSLEALQDLMRAATGDEIVTFNRALLELFRAGDIDHETGLAYASNPEEFALNAQGMATGVATFRSDSVTATSTLDIKSLLGIVETRGASDLHVAVGRPPMLRVSGELRPMDLPPLSGGDVRLLLYSMLSVTQRTTYELDRELDFALALDGGRRFRVNVYYEKGNMAAAFRSIPIQAPDAEKLGLPEVVLEIGEAPHGLLLVVGPTGAGKTTTLACLVDRINRSRSCHIITIEDPIEYTYESLRATIHQREIGADTKSFAAALKYILRQDPDVILVGELRDLETIGAALTAAETGHLVLATLHTNDAIQTVDRIVDVFPAHQQDQARAQLAASLLGVISQRLLPRRDERGRVAAFEVMLANPAMRTLIRENKMHQALSLMQAGRQVGMNTLDDALVDLVERGLIRERDALRYLRNPNALGRISDPD